MAVRDRAFLSETIKKFTDGKTDDETIQILEDFSDTLDDYESRVTDKEDWKGKYEQLDADWRKRYTERFYNDEKADEVVESSETKLEEEKVTRNFDDLFD